MSAKALKIFCKIPFPPTWENRAVVYTSGSQSKQLGGSVPERGPFCLEFFFQCPPHFLAPPLGCLPVALGTLLSPHTAVLGSRVWGPQQMTCGCPSSLPQRADGTVLASTALSSAPGPSLHCRVAPHSPLISTGSQWAVSDSRQFEYRES